MAKTILQQITPDGISKTYSDNSRLSLLTDFLERNHIDYLIQNSNDGNEIKNLIIPARIQQNKNVLIAHYDIAKGSLGMLDNGMACALLLRHLKENQQDHIEYVFSDKEEIGGKGAELYMKKNAHLINRLLNIDTIGVGNVLFVDNEDNSPIIANIFNEIPSTISMKIPPCDHWFIKKYSSKVTSLLTGYGASMEAWLPDLIQYFHGNCYDNTLENFNPEIIEDTYSFIKKWCLQMIPKAA